jgi:hypothetical protein
VDVILKKLPFVCVVEINRVYFDFSKYFINSVKYLKL